MLSASIIIPSYNAAYQLERALRSLVKIDFEPNRYEIIIVDNGSSDNTEFVVNDFVKNNPLHNLRYIHD